MKVRHTHTNIRIYEIKPTHIKNKFWVYIYENKRPWHRVVLAGTAAPFHEVLLYAVELLTNALIGESVEG